MSQSSKFINGGMALLLISGAGCAGNGLRSMFSRNETAGYKTLEELEAERLEKENSATDDSGPKFASWLPFGSRTKEETAVAAAETESSEEESGTRAGGWWKNPFRRQETVEADPFLTGDEPAEAVVARREKSPASRDASSARRGEVAESGTTPGAKPSSPVRNAGQVKEVTDPVTDTKKAESDTDETLLAEKFENHFRKNTAEAAESVEEISALIVAGQENKPTAKASAQKTAAQKTGERSAVADDKLLEFERLLAEKKAAATRKAEKSAPSTSQDSGTEDDWNVFEDAVPELADSPDRKPRESKVVKPKAGSTVSSFDSLLSETAEARPASRSGSRNRQAPHASPLVDQEVSVADAEGLFGTRSVKSSSAGSGSSDSAGAWSASTEPNGGSNWAAAARPAGQKRRELAQKVLSATVDEFAEAFAASRGKDRVPPAALPDTPDAQALPPGAGNSPEQSTQRRRAGSAIQTVSSGRQLPGPLEKPTGLQQDQWFSAASASAPLVSDSEMSIRPSASRSSVGQASLTTVSPVQNMEKPARTKASGGARLQTRTWLLLLGGIIVVALLFAPSRKKPIEANQFPAQG